MKGLIDRKEIAKALNFGQYPVLSIDVSKCDSYGLVGCPCRIHMGSFRDGMPWYEQSELRVYYDEKLLTFSAGGCCLHSSFGYNDIIEDMEYAQAPIIKPNSEFVLITYDSKTKEVYNVMIVSTEKVQPHCMTPIVIEEVKLDGLIQLAAERYGKFEC